jgi:hypothetical protein
MKTSSPLSLHYVRIIRIRSIRNNNPVDIPEAGEVRLDVYNILGEKVATLVQGRHEIGRYTIRWDASGMASGMYFYRISSAKFTATKKLVLMK